MAFEVPKINYSGAIKEIRLGKKEPPIMVGGETCYPFHLFEGSMPNLPRIAMEVYDSMPDNWPEAAVEPFKDVMGDPVKWARKCVTEFGAQIICLQMASTDPNGLNRGADEAAETARQVTEAVDVPVIVWGTANQEKDTEVLRKIAEVCQGKQLIIGPLEEGNYKKIAASAIGYRHMVIASSPIDINLAKQLNILLTNMDVPENEILIDPTVSSIGYGIEYCYSVMERIRMAALTQQDEKLQMPIICNVAKETWKAKEVKISSREAPELGDEKKRGILLEAMSATVLLLAGGDVVIMRHPEAIRLVEEIIGELAG
ncbi:MAG: acetyl-CoA decarbonylase/synthase complex subunit delta [Dehalococcoidaceae bacterium]|nr:acetyl-CoA decarbonylase/synthase complex subunit delta [Dehalococcoidaceae bacterium]